MYIVFGLHLPRDAHGRALHHNNLIKIIIIAPLTIVSEDQWGDLECIFNSCSPCDDYLYNLAQPLAIS